MQPLNPLTLPLQGQILIEASAGTGKTYTIGLLFLRLLMERGLSVDRILVVTFTRAATEELRGRIRQRIREALDVLTGRSPGDQSLQELMAKVTEVNQATILLSDALTRMDEAAIFTIHGFCQRMLQEHAFESGAPFEMEFLETEQVLRRRIIEDFWRLRFYRAPKEEAAWAASQWNEPQDLLTNLGGHLSRPGVECVPVIDQEELDGQMEALVPLFVQARGQWLEQRAAITTLLQESKRLSRNKSTGYGLQRLQQAAQTLDSFFAEKNMPWLMPNTKVLELFTTGKIETSLKKSTKHEPPVHPFFDLFDRFFQAHQEMTRNRKIFILLEARNYLLTELDRRKEEQGQLYFDDLLTQLDTGLQGTGGRQLAQSIRTRFPVILVDEFQDTDPLQYRIFSTIHENSTKNSGLFLIGDPKQAIYGFRGADIFTYIKARRDTAAENRFTMTTNYRSTSPMVAAVNQLFDREESFLFNKDAIDFTPVKAAGMADDKPLLIDNTPPPALTCLLLPENATDKPLAKGTAAEQAARFCAHEIGDLLAAGLTERARIGDQPLSAGDIAVLVRTHTEADLVRKELTALSITSVYYSQESVFATPEAEQMAVVLSGLVDLADSGLVRTGLATDLFGYNAEQLDCLRSDEQQWEEVMTTLGRYHQMWRLEGFTPMFQTLLAEQQVVRRLHGADSGERRLTNFLHLAELLQEAAQRQAGAEGLLRWLLDQIQAPEEQDDSRQLRLESDENLVKIVTIHKAKGLEYPVVFLPFLWSARTCQANEPLAFHDPERPDRLLIDLGTGDEEHFKLAEQERLAGDLRLLYVAVTRARYSCYFCWGRINKMQESALCYLLHNDDMPGLETISNDLDLNTEHSALLLKPYPLRFLRPELQTRAKTTPPAAARFTGHIDSSWRITSYSRLTAHQDPQPERPDYDQEAEAAAPAPGHDVFGFAKGAAAGTCLHSILEQISFTDPGGHEEIIRSQLERAGFDASWIPVVASWMEAILRTGLEPGFSLCLLAEQDRINEMSFYFPLQSMNLNSFNRALADFSIPPLPDQQETLQGLMVGFIDLVYRRNGCYFVADYKSNHLGGSAADYRPENLQAAMLEHRYDLQYLIYTLALHRFLSSRIAEYDYEAHFGGVRYLFLRGMDPENPPGTGIFSTRPPLALINRLDRCCRGIEI